MANLNIPFLLLQPSMCDFHPTLATTKLIPYHKYNFKPLNAQIKHPNASGNHGEFSASHLMPSSERNTQNFSSMLSHNSLHPQSTQNHHYELGKYSTFEDTPKNLIVMGDKKSGTLILCHQEHYISTKKNEQFHIASGTSMKQKSVTKFIVSLIPRCALIPSISEESGAVLDYTLVRSPAPNILSTSTHFLITLHEDNRIRLWNTNDGRCVMVSQKDMLVTKAIKIQEIKNHPGNVLVIGASKDVYVVNVYKMIVYKHFQYEIDGCVGCSFRDKQLVICDQRGKIYVWKDDSEASPIKNLNSTNMFDLTNHQDDYESFSYNLEQAIGEDDDIENNKILAYNYLSNDQVFVVSQHRVDLYLQKTRKTLFTFQSQNSQLVFSKFLNISEREMLLIIDVELNVYLFDLTKLKHEAQTNNNLNRLNMKEMSLLKDVNLIRECRFFENNLIKHEDHQNIFNDADEIKSNYVEKIRAQLRGLMGNSNSVGDGASQIFRYSKVENILYSIVEIDGQPKMISWSFETAIENLNYATELTREFRLPLFVNNINIFPQPVQSCPINFYSLVIKNIYNKHQFQFFFSDEHVTDSIVYASIDNPSLIIGTNYGRIFMVPMFQESDEKIYPIILIDQHHQSPITQLFIAYESSRRIKSGHKSSSNLINGGTNLNSSNFSSKDNLQEVGGHLISASEDGTIAITNLNSGEIHKALSTFSLQDKAKSRADTFMEEMNENRKHKRRNSITQCFQMNQFYHMVKVKSQSVYDYTAFGRIERIIEVKSIIKLQEKVLNSQKVTTLDKNTDEASFQGVNYQQQLNSKAPQPPPTYACISEDGMIMILHLSTLACSLHKLHGIDSKAIGVYSNEELSQYYVLTEKMMNIFVYNKKSLVLERKSDYKFAMSVLFIREAVEYLLSKNESIRQATSSDHNLFEYESFELLFRRKSLLMMGQGSHKILDFLSLSLNLPLQYHPHNMFQGKYTKSLLDLLSNYKDLTDFSKKEEAQKLILRIINDCFFMNNSLYKSDFNEEYYQKQSGVSVVQTQNTVFGSKQQLIIANTKQMINVMKNKMIKIKTQQKQGASSQNGVKLQTQMTQSRPGDKPTTQMDFDGEEQKHHHGQRVTPRGSRSSRKIPNLQGSMQSSDSYMEEGLSKYKWPVRLLSLIHPFNIDMNVDETLERFFGLNLPFLDFRLGIQGAEESFSFVISKEDEEYHSERQNIAKMLRLLRLSRYQKSQQRSEEHKMPPAMSHHTHKTDGMQSVLEYNISADIDAEVPDRFFGSENWKMSSYLSTIVPTFFLSNLVSIVEYNQQDITFLLQEWVYILQRINQQKTLHNYNAISLSVVSKLLLKKDPNISTTGRDIIMKPILYTIDVDQLKYLIDEWSHLILETYRKVKRDSSVKSNYGQGSNNNNNNQANNNQQQDRKLINKYFGELEIRGLVNISYFALYYFDQLDHQLQYRVSKLTTILTREIVQKFDKNKKYIHLLTLLLQILSIWMKNQSNQFNNKPLISEVIKLLLYIYNINKSPLNKENVITRVTGQNFHLIKPTHPELYLKLTAARALLEIGENFTYDFLQLIQEEATHLQQSAEYQQNVLEVLKFFINGYGENLENHLIQLTQILLKCLDPNELALRKNSHKIISVILSIMRLAVGTHDGPIAIYDVRTSAKWKILEGHSGNVTCLTFDSRGNLLASYSAVDQTLRLWKVGNTGFFSTIMGGTGKSANTINLDPIRSVKNPHQLLMMKKHQSVQQQDMRSNNNLLDEAVGGNSNTNNMALSQISGGASALGNSQNPGAQGSSSGGNNKRINKCSIKFVMPKEKQVELTREDGVNNSYKLVK
eukprot:403363397